jgi:hypothetical protein
MPSTDAFALQKSDLNGFLFADVGIEPSGNTLSVLSALARMGMDPWQEGGRLAKLPQLAAIDALAKFITVMPSSQWSLPDATAIASRLVALLPGGTKTAAVADMDGSKVSRTHFQFAVVFAILASLAAGSILNFLTLPVDVKNGPRTSQIAAEPPVSAAQPTATHPAVGQ